MDSNLHIGDKEYEVKVEHRKQSKTCPEYAAVTITIPTKTSREEIVIFFNDMGGLNDFCMRLGYAVIKAEQ